MARQFGTWASNYSEPHPDHANSAAKWGSRPGYFVALIAFVN